MRIKLSNGLDHLMKISQSSIKELNGVVCDLKGVDLRAINDDIYSLKDEKINIYEYAKFFNFRDMDCAKMAWEFSNNKISSLEFNRYKVIIDAISDCYSTAVVLLNRMREHWGIPWIVAANIQFHRGDFEELPEEIINASAKDIYENDGARWWFQYDISIIKRRNCAYLEELDLSGEEWNRSYSPIRFLLTTI